METTDVYDSPVLRLMTEQYLNKPEDFTEEDWNLTCQYEFGFVIKAPAREEAQ